MKYLKMLGLAAIAAGALMAFVGAGTASATELECGESMCAEHTTIHAEASSTVILHPVIGNIECKKSTVSGTTENTGSSSETVKGPIASLTWGECNTEEIKTLEAGSLEVHTDANDTAGTSGNGTLTSIGAKVTVKFLGFHCIFGTNNPTDIGTITGSRATGGTPVLMIEARIERIGGTSGAFCGGTSEWTGSYAVDNPMTMNIK
jgi:hypothetical protein